MKHKALIICKKGIGDSLQHLIVAYSLMKNGYEVEFFSNSLQPLKNLFSFVKISPISDEMLIEEKINKTSLIVIKSDHDADIQAVMALAKKQKQISSWILHPTTCKSRGKLPGDFPLDPTQSMVENLQKFCTEALHLQDVNSFNGIEIPTEWSRKKFPKRVVIHPTSSNEKRNWPSRKFLTLCKRLKANGFDPVLVMSQDEQEAFPTHIYKDVKILSGRDLTQIARLLYESGYFIGNDSGIGHLASNLSVPSLTIFASRRKRHLWLPRFNENSLGVASLPVLPNLKFCRWQNKYWEKALPVWLVWRSFQKLLDL